MAMNECSTCPKAPASLDPYHQNVLCHIQDTSWGILSLCSDAVDVFYCLSWLGKLRRMIHWLILTKCQLFLFYFIPTCLEISLMFRMCVCFFIRSPQIWIIFKNIYLIQRSVSNRLIHSVQNESAMERYSRFPVVHNWSLTIIFSLVSYSVHPFSEGDIIIVF